MPYVILCSSSYLYSPCNLLKVVWFFSFVFFDMKDISKEANVISKKCEALAVSGLAEYGDEIDIIAPVDILKQIFKIPYSKARVSIAVQRVGQTLVLNPGWVPLLYLSCNFL